MRLNLIQIWMTGGAEPIDRTKKNFGESYFFVTNIEFLANKVLSHILTTQPLKVKHASLKPISTQTINSSGSFFISVPNNACMITIRSSEEIQELLKIPKSAFKKFTLQ